MLNADTAFGEWAYLPNGVMTHFRPRVAGVLLDTAMCEAEPNDGDAEWHGTGSKQEAEHVAFLPQCRLCCAVLRRAAGRWPAVSDLRTWTRDEIKALRKKIGLNFIEHGRAVTYTYWGCHCVRCGDAQRLDAANQRARKLASAHVREAGQP